MLTAAALLALVLAVYGASCLLNPFQTCGRCHGGGERSVFLSRDTVTCRACRGAGQRLRPGARLWAAATGRSR